MKSGLSTVQVVAMPHNPRRWYRRGYQSDFELMNVANSDAALPPNNLFAFKWICQGARALVADWWHFLFPGGRASGAKSIGTKQLFEASHVR
jgi:hypothetical protein